MCYGIFDRLFTFTGYHMLKIRYHKNQIDYCVIVYLIKVRLRVVLLVDHCAILMHKTY